MSLSQTKAAKLTVLAGQTTSEWMTLRNLGDAAHVGIFAGAGGTAGVIEVGDADPGPQAPFNPVNPATYQIRDAANALIDATIPLAGKAATYPDLGCFPSVRIKLAVAPAGNVVYNISKQYECSDYAKSGY